MRESLIHSNINFDGFDYQKALCYIRNMAGADIMKSSGLQRLIPKWGGDRVESLKVTGSSGKKIENWSFSSHIPCNGDWGVSGNGNTLL